jgi:hypothetical protein
MTKTNLMLIGVLLAVSLACGSTNNSAASKSNSMVGSWAISATNGVGGQSVFQVIAVQIRGLTTGRAEGVARRERERD